MIRMTLLARRITDIAGRPGTVLDNGLIRVVVEDFAGMTPELSFPNGAGRINTHFVPGFRGSSCAYDAAKHAGVWGGRLAHELAGNFPCFPTFGWASKNRGYEVPGCGHTAQGEWTVESYGADGHAAWLVSVMGGASGAETAGLTYRKYDILLAGDETHYQAIKIRNHRPDTFMFGGAWHNTTGRPFVGQGCRISAGADRWATPPVSHDPAQNESLALGREFESLAAAPARDGSTLDLSVVPGAVGTTDFLTGRIPPEAKLGWMSVVNPDQNAIYLTFFRGPAVTPADEFTFRFNHLWLQYGGRNFPPFARYEGGADHELAVGVESAVSAWGYGLDYCDEHPVLMGNPTILPLLPGEEKTLFQGTLAGRIGSDALDNGIRSVDTTPDGLILTGAGGDTVRKSADSGFVRIKALVARLDARRE